MNGYAKGQSIFPITPKDTGIATLRFTDSIYRLPALLAFNHSTNQGVYKYCYSIVDSMVAQALTAKLLC